MASEEESEQECDIMQLLEVEERERYEQKRRLEKEYMIKQSKETAERLRQQHVQDQETKFVHDQQQMVEQISGISLKPGRDIFDEQLQALVERQIYIKLDSIDTQVSPRHPSTANYYTIGILCRSSGLQKAQKSQKSQKSQKAQKVQKAQTGKSYIKWEFTSLKKCTIVMDAARSRTPIQSGYKVVSVFLYEQAATQLERESIGGVYVIFNPTPLPKSEKYPYALKVVSPEQIHRIGMALDFGQCSHNNPTLGKRCSNFVNTSWEKYCEVHVQQSVTSIKSRRPIFQSAYVDITQVRSDNEPFLHGGHLNKKAPNKPEPKLSQADQDKFDKWQQEQGLKLDSYMKRRAEVPTGNPLNRLASAQSEGAAVIIDLDEQPVVDSSFIQQLMAKKKKASHSEKFGPDPSPPNAKRPKLDLPPPHTPPKEIELQLPKPLREKLAMPLKARPDPDFQRPQESVSGSGSGIPSTPSAEQTKPSNLPSASINPSNPSAETTISSKVPSAKSEVQTQVPKFLQLASKPKADSAMQAKPSAPSQVPSKQTASQPNLDIISDNTISSDIPVPSQSETLCQNPGPSQSVVQTQPNVVPIPPSSPSAPISSQQLQAQPGVQECKQASVTADKQPSSESQL